MDIEYKKAPILGYEGLYEVDTNGVVFSMKKGTPMKPQIGRGGYPSVILRKGKSRNNMTIHRIVAETFIPNPDNLPEINHKDETRTNSRVDNLEWCTHKYNVNYGTAIERRRKKLHGRPEPKWKSEAQSKRMKEYWSKHRHPRKLLDIECVNDGNVFHSFCEVERTYGIDRRRVKKMCETGIEKDGLSFRYL